MWTKKKYMQIRVYGYTEQNEEMRMEIGVISMKGAVSGRLERSLRRAFPTTEVQRMPGIDVRAVGVDALWRSGAVSSSTAEALRVGRRKWHFGVPSKGAIGCWHAMRLAVSRRSDVPLLLCEEDCVIQNESALRRDVAHLLAHADGFDMAVFGGYMWSGRDTTNPPVDFMEPDARGTPRWRRLHADHEFFRLQCVLYTPRGRRNVTRALQGYAQDMQIDAFYGHLSRMGQLTVYVTPHVATQYVHLSSIQETLGSCPLCDDTSVVSRPTWGVVAAMIVVACAATIMAVAACTRHG